MKIYWSKSGDELTIDVVNQELVNHWYNSLPNDTLTLITKPLHKTIDPLAVDLYAKIQLVNQHLEQFKIEKFSETISFNELIKHTSLNRLHSHWTYLSEKKKCTTLFSKLSLAALPAFLAINDLVHAIEKVNSVAYSVDNYSIWQTPNTFGNSILDFGLWNVCLGYSNLGKTYYDKWASYDTNFVDHDTNNYTHLGGILHFQLVRPHKQVLPVDYINFCNENQIEPLGNVVPIGNFKEELDNAKEIFYNNSKIENNYIQLNKD
jgi:hypothetical protein